MGDNNRALEWLTAAFDDRDGLCALFAHWPVLDPLRSDPRFQSLLGKMNFPALPPTAVVKEESAVVPLSESTVNADALTTVVATPPEPDIPSIAVLPFLNMSADLEQEYFCDGLSEELIDALARLEGLRVVARTSAFQFRGKGHDLREVGQKLKVKTVLEGSVRKAGNRLRVNAQLINTEDGYHLWTERYDRELEDVFEVQDDIARAVVGKLKVKLLGLVDERLVPDCNGRIAATGFCFGGGMSNTLAVLLGADLAAAAPFYGGAPAAEDVPKVRAAMLVHHGALDTRLVGAYPDYEAAMQANNVTHEGHIYPDSVHGFFNDATPERYNQVAAEEAWTRTIAWFNQYTREA